MPAYNAAKTLRKTFEEVSTEKIVDLVIVVDDGSNDETVSIARSLRNTFVYTHDRNRGYGANQKSCYNLAMEKGGDIIIMVHPDYQYTPKLIPAMGSLIANGLAVFRKFNLNLNVIPSSSTSSTIFTRFFKYANLIFMGLLNSMPKLCRAFCQRSC